MWVFQFVCLFFIGRVARGKKKRRFTRVVNSPLIDGWLSLQELLKKEMTGKLYFWDQSV